MFSCHNELFANISICETMFIFSPTLVKNPPNFLHAVRPPKKGHWNHPSIKQILSIISKAVSPPKRHRRVTLYPLQS